MAGTDPTIQRTVWKCGACGAKHVGISFSRLAQPIHIDGKRMTHRGTCPRTLIDIFTERRSKAS